MLDDCRHPFSTTLYNINAMSTRTKEASEGDVIVARALSTYAQLRANIASWSSLPATPATASVEPSDEDEELFTAESETYDYIPGTVSHG